MKDLDEEIFKATQITYSVMINDLHKIKILLFEGMHKAIDENDDDAFHHYEAEYHDIKTIIEELKKLRARSYGIKEK